MVKKKKTIWLLCLEAGIFFSLGELNSEVNLIVYYTSMRSFYS